MRVYPCLLQHLFCHGPPLVGRVFFEVSRLETSIYREAKPHGEKLCPACATLGQKLLARQTTVSLRNEKVRPKSRQTGCHVWVHTDDVRHFAGSIYCKSINLRRSHDAEQVAPNRPLPHISIICEWPMWALMRNQL